MFLSLCPVENLNMLLKIYLIFTVVCVYSVSYYSGLVYISRSGIEGNVLFNDALTTFYLRLYGVELMVKDHSDSEKGNTLPPHGLLFPISSKEEWNQTLY